MRLQTSFAPRLPTHLQCALIAALGTACADSNTLPTESPIQPSLAQHDDIARDRLFQWSDLPAVARSQTRRLDANGGVLALPGVKLIIPRGALVAPVELTISIAAGEAAAYVQLLPQGTSFKRPIRLEFNSAAVNASGEEATILYWRGDHWQSMPSTRTRDGAAIAANLAHFSVYGVGACGPVGPVVGEGEGDEACREPVPDLQPGAPGIYVDGWSWNQCYKPAAETKPAWWADVDLDNTHDFCEEALVDAFAPILHAAGLDCIEEPFYGRLGGEYYWAAKKMSLFLDFPLFEFRDVVRLAFLPAYYHDCGNATQIFGIFDTSTSHSGDSELIAVDVGFDAASNHWVTRHVFMSAHCGEGGIGIGLGDPGSACRWYVDDLDFGAAGDGLHSRRPGVWVSLGKHANYPSAEACEWGYPLVAQIDFCPDNNGYVFEFPTWFGTNIGQRPPNDFLNCFEGYYLSAWKVPGEEECVWSNFGKFYGWQGGGKGSTAYGEVLEMIVF